MWKKNAFSDDASDSDEETYQVMYRHDTAKDLLNQFQDNDDTDSPPLYGNAGKTPTSALSLEQEIFSKSQSQLSIPSTASKPVKLSTIQRESQQSQLFYQSINQSQSSESQVEVLDDDEDFDNFFSSSPVVEKRKKNIEHTKSPSWTQVITPMKTKPKTQHVDIEDIDDFSDEEDDFISAHHRKPNSGTRGLQIEQIDERGVSHTQRSPYLSPPNKKSKVTKSQPKRTAPKQMVSPSQFVGNYNIQSRLADLQQSTQRDVLQPKRPLSQQPRAERAVESAPVRDEIVYDEEDDIMMHEEHEDERIDRSMIQEEPQPNDWLANLRQQSHLSQQPSNQSSRSGYLKHMRSVGYQGRLKSAIASISGGLTLLNHNLNSNRGTQQPKLSQSVISEECIVVRIISERDEPSHYFTVCKLDEEFVDVLFDKATKEKLNLCVGKKIRIYQPFVQYEDGIRKVISCTFYSMEIQDEQLNTNVSAELKQFESLFNKPLQSEQATATRRRRGNVTDTPAAQRRANIITSPGRTTRRLRFDDNSENSVASALEQPAPANNAIPQINIKMTSKSFNADFLHNEIVSVRATVIHQWIIEKLLTDLHKSLYHTFCKTRNTILARTSEGLCLIDIPFKEFTYWSPLFEHGTGRQFEFSFLKYCGKRIVREGDTFYSVLQSLETNGHEFYEVDIFRCHGNEARCQVVHNDELVDLTDASLQQIPVTETIAELPTVSKIDDDAKQRVRIAGRVVLLRDLRESLSPHAFVVYLQTEDAIQQLFITRNTKHARDLVMSFTLCFGKQISVETASSILVDEWTKISLLETMDEEDDAQDEITHRKHIESIFDSLETKLEMELESVGSGEEMVMKPTIVREDFKLYDIGLVEGYMTDVIIPNVEDPKPYIRTCSECNAPVANNVTQNFCRHCGRTNNTRFSLSLNALMTERIHLRVDHGTVEKIFRRHDDRAMIISGSERHDQAKKVLVRKDKSKFLCFCYGVDEKEGVKHVYLEAVGVDRRSGKLRNLYDPQWHVMDL